MPEPCPPTSDDPQANSGDDRPSATSECPPDDADLRLWLAKLCMGQATVDQALAAISLTQSRNPGTMPIDGATVDLAREQRCGFGEVIYGEGKPADLISRITDVQLKANQDVFVTRVAIDAAKELQDRYPHCHFNPDARTIRIASQPVRPATPLAESEAQSQINVAVVTAGSTDAPVAEETVETLAWMGIPFQFFEDIGVAGPQRLLGAVPKLRLASAVVVIAGMEGALPSVVAGHMSVPIFAVPTSVGYGATLGGLTPLMGMLSGCAANVAVVNIDAGFKGGYLAGLVVNQLRQAKAFKR